MPNKVRARPGPSTLVTSDADERRRLLALWLTALAPLVWIPGGLSRFVLAKLFITLVAALLATTVRALGALPRSAAYAATAWAALFALAAVVGETPIASLLGRWPRYEGLPTLLIYGLACWSGARVVGRGQIRLIHLGHALGCLGIALGALSLLDLMGFSPVGPTSARDGSVLGNATDQAAVGMMTMLLLAPIAIRERRPFPVAVVVAGLVTLAAAGSRTAIALGVVGLLMSVVVAAGPGRRPSRQMVLTSAAVLAALAVAVVAVPVSRSRLLGLGTGQGRLDQWSLTWPLVREHLLLGLGPSRYLDAFTSYESAGFVRFTGSETLADSPHQVFLQVLLAGGVPLLLATLVGMAVVFRAAWMNLRVAPALSPVAVALLAYLVLLQLNFTAAGPTCLAAFLLGVLIARDPTEHQERRIVPLLAMTTSAALAAVVLMACVGDVLMQRSVEEAATGKVRPAISTIDAAQRWRAWDPDAAMIGALALTSQASGGDATAATATVRLAQKSLDTVPGDYSSLVSLGIGQAAGGDLEDAEITLDEAVNVAPFRPGGYLQRARVRASRGDVSGARADLARLLSITPHSRLARLFLRQLD